MRDTVKIASNSLYNFPKSFWNRGRKFSRTQWSYCTNLDEQISFILRTKTSFWLNQIQKTQKQNRQSKTTNKPVLI